MGRIYVGSNEVFGKYIGNTYFAVQNIEFQPETINFLNATGITNTDIRDALDTLVVGLKDALLWDKMDIIYPFVADNTSSLSTQFGYNLKDTSSFNPIFNNGVNGDLNGYKSDSSTTKYIDTTYIPTSSIVGKNIHVSIYTTDAYNSLVPAGDAIDWGSFVVQSAVTKYSYLVTGRSFDGTNTTKLLGFLTTPISTSSLSEAGYTIAYNNNATSESALFLNNATQFVTSSAQNGNIGVISTYFGAWNNNGTGDRITNKQYQFFTVGDTIPSSSVGTLNSLVQTFQESIDTALGTSRAV